MSDLNPAEQRKKEKNKRKVSLALSSGFFHCRDRRRSRSRKEAHQLARWVRFLRRIQPWTRRAARPLRTRRRSWTSRSPHLASCAALRSVLSRTAGVRAAVGVCRRTRHGREHRLSLPLCSSLNRFTISPYLDSAKMMISQKFFVFQSVLDFVKTRSVLGGSSTLQCN